MPVNSFAPELMKLYMVAHEHEVILPFDTKKEATRFRFRCHDLRRNMRKEDHDLVRIAEGVQFSIRETETGFCVVCGPSDDSFVEKLRAAGIKIDEPDPTLDDDLPSEVDPLTPMTYGELTASEQALREFLANDKEDE